MPKYKYTVKNKEGKTINEVEQAFSKLELINILKARGFYILSIKEIKDKDSSLSSLFSFKKKRKRQSIKLYDLALFARNLAVMLSSGVTLLRALEILSSQADSQKLEKVLKDCTLNVKAGMSFKEAISKHPNVFNFFWQGIIEVGEASGNLPFVLEKLADYLEERIEFQRKIISALIYPCILLVAAILAMFVFFKFILPKFTVIFEQFNIPLPMLTKIVFNISKTINSNFFFIILALLGLVITSVYFKGKKEFKNKWDKIALSLPIVGKVVFLACLERLTSTIYILLDSGLPLVSTLEISSRGIGNSVLEKKIIAIKDKVRAGCALSDEFRKSEIFPLLISEMAKIGEETGSLPVVFQKIAAHYKREFTTKVERMVSAFEPLMILFMGIIIGCIVISLFIPLFKVSTLGGGG